MVRQQTCHARCKSFVTILHEWWDGLQQPITGGVIVNNNPIMGGVMVSNNPSQVV